MSSSQQPPRTEAEIVELVRSIDARAPQEVHERVHALVADRADALTARRRSTMRWGVLAGATAVAALIAVLIVSLSAGGGSTLTLDKAVALTLRPATMNAPEENPHDGRQLMVAVDGVPFPYWEESFGFRATGERIDHIARRTVTTVFYADPHNHWIGYAIVGGTPAPAATGGVVVQRRGVPYRVLTYDGARVVTWLRDGRLCVVAGHGVSTATLLSLASWHAVGTALSS